MKIKDFFDLYREPEDDNHKVWVFVIDKDICFDNIRELYLLHSHILEKEITDFTIVSQLDYEIDTTYSREGLNVYPKTKVFIYTEDWKD